MKTNKHNNRLTSKQVQTVSNAIASLSKDIDKLNDDKLWQEAYMLEKQVELIMLLSTTNEVGVSLDSAKSDIGALGVFTLGAIQGIGLVKFDPVTGAFHLRSE